MRVDVLFGAAAVTQADVAGRVVAVIDVLRASSTIATALDHGARCVVPFDSAEAVIQRSKSFARDEVRLAGERRMFPVPGFDFGNSPLEFTREAVEDRTILFSTTNGTPALVASQGARDVVVASYVNFSAALSFLRAAVRGSIDVTIVCAGRERYFALEDAACAGRFVRCVTEGMRDVVLNDGAIVCAHLDRHHGDRIDELFAAAEHGRALAAAGFVKDLAACAAIDAHPVVPIYVDRQIVALGPDWER